METRPYFIHALSPVHAGTGQAVDVIDLPIARVRSTGIPMIPGSSIKGSLRDVHTRASSEGEKDQTVQAIFGPNIDNASAHAGAISVGDAWLLALPVRSFKGTFAWVSCPLLLDWAQRILKQNTNCPKKLPRGRDGRWAANCETSCNTILVEGTRKIFLEDIDLSSSGEPNVDDWGKFLATVLFGSDKAGERQREMFEKRFVVVDDETMTFLWETATQIDTRIKINGKTRTVQDGALWVEESLPPETLMVGLLSALPSLNDVSMSAEQVLDAILSEERVVQFGGNATVGRGRCRLLPAG